MATKTKNSFFQLNQSLKKYEKNQILETMNKLRDQLVHIQESNKNVFIKNSSISKGNINYQR